MNKNNVSLPEDNQSLNSRCSCMAHDLWGKVHFHGTLSNRKQVGVSVSLYSRRIMKFVSCLYCFSMCSHLAITLRLELHIIFPKKCRANFKSCGLSYCFSCLTLKLEEWLTSGWTQTFHGLDTVGSYVQTVATTRSLTFWHAPRIVQASQLLYFDDWGSKPPAASTCNADNRPWKVERDLQCSTSCPDFQNPQILQRSEISD